MVGRPSKYESNVKPYLTQIKYWASEGATEKQIQDKLDIGHNTWINYKEKYSELQEALKAGRIDLVKDIKGILVKKAMGFEYKEKKEYIKEDESGTKNKYIEITTKQSLPDTTAIYGVLNLYDQEYVKDKKNYELKKEELQLRKELAKANNFDLDID